jgi:PAS domain-containing protein
LFVSISISSRQFGEAEVPNEDRSRDYSDLSPELLEIVRALQTSLTEKRVRQQLQAVDSKPSMLESALSRQQAKRATQPHIASHPQLLAAVVESADAAIISETWNGVVLTWNRGAERIFGYSADEILGKTRVPQERRREDNAAGH